MLGLKIKRPPITLERLRVAHGITNDTEEMPGRRRGPAFPQAGFANGNGIIKAPKPKQMLRSL
jgi:hypothetical protein